MRRVLIAILVSGFLLTIPLIQAGTARAIEDPDIFGPLIAMVNNTDATVAALPAVQMDPRLDVMIEDPDILPGDSSTALTTAVARNYADILVLQQALGDLEVAPDSCPRDSSEVPPGPCRLVDALARQGIELSQVVAAILPAGDNNTLTLVVLSDPLRQ